MTLDLDTMEPRWTKDGRVWVECSCGWESKRKIRDCECYDYTCSPEAGGIGCPRGWGPCPKCGGRIRRQWVKAKTQVPRRETE